MDILRKHSKIVLTISVILFLAFIFQEKFTLLKNIQTNNTTNVVCLFLILTIGISHGALDHLKGQKILKVFKIDNPLLFYIAYILIGFLIIFLWFLFPTFTLVFFLIVASFHFGKEDTEFLFKEKKIWYNLIYLTKGLLIIYAPLLWHNKETIDIFLTLGADYSFINHFVRLEGYLSGFFWVIFIGYMVFLFELIKNHKSDEDPSIFIADFIPIILLNMTFSPLIAFTLYFCFIHSFKHSVSLINELDNENFGTGTKKFIKKAAPLTIITGIMFLSSLGILTNYYVLNDAILKVIFIGLASLTFPHILLEYLIEKNEK
jgi:Brp/Blh family beta-carotene 15,15'-monooxygenase